MPHGRFTGETVPHHLESFLEIPNRATCHVAPCIINRLATQRHVEGRILGSHAVPYREVVTSQVAKPRRRQWPPVPSPPPVSCHQANDSPTSCRLWDQPQRDGARAICSSPPSTSLGHIAPTRLPVRRPAYPQTTQLPSPLPTRILFFPPRSITSRPPQPVPPAAPPQATQHTVSITSSCLPITFAPPTLPPALAPTRPTQS